MATDSAQIQEGLRNAGIAPGDVLHVHSSLKSFGEVAGGADAVIDALLAAVGPAGLVSVPTHTFDTVTALQPVFHETLSPSLVGLITNVFRLRPGAIRSLHPTHSVAAIGPRAAEFTAGHELDDTPCGCRSPYQRLVEWNGKAVMLGVRLDSCTLMHAFEEMAGIPWLFTPGFEELWSIRKDGTVIRTPSRRHARDREFDRSFSELEPMLVEKGILRYGPIGEAQIRVVAARPAAELLVPLFKESPGFLLKKN